MAQQFQADAQMVAAGITLVTVAETNGPVTNALSPPFPTGYKAKVIAVAQILTGAGATGVQLRLRRNIANENVVLFPVLTVAAAASTQIQVSIAATDQVPDGRTASYTLSVQQVAAGGNGSIAIGTYIEAVVLSG
jgi:hypothetical protein